MQPQNNIGIRKRIGLSAFGQYRKAETKLHELNYLFWECTLRCNLNCVHCGSDCKVDSLQKDMPLQDFIQVIDEITPIVNPNKTTIVLTGGEPLMRKDIEQCGLELYSRGFPWGLVTNGLLLSEERLQSLMESGLRTITISLDGFETEHNWFRGNKKSFAKAKQAIQLVVKQPNLIYDVVTCVNKQNILYLKSFKEELIRWGVKKWRLFTVFPIGRAKDNELLSLSGEEFRELFDFIAITRKQAKINVSYGCEGFLGHYEREVRDDFFFCKAGINIGSVLVDGSISACPSLRENFTQGNIYQDSFVDIWENKFDVMRNRSWTKTGKCATCTEYKHCEGNGLHLRNEKTGELLFCHHEKLNAK